MPSLRRTVRSRTCVAASRAASAAKASLSPTKTKAHKRRTPGVSPKGSTNEAAKGSSSQKDQGGPKAKAASEDAKGSSSHKDQGSTKAKAASGETKGLPARKDQGSAKAKPASEEAKGLSTRKDQDNAKAKAANEEAKGMSGQKAAVMKGQGRAEAKAANEAPRGSSRGGAKAANEEAARAEDQGGAKASKEVEHGGAVTRLRRPLRSSDGASTSTARSVSPSSSDDERVDDPDYVAIKRPRLLCLRTPLNPKETLGTKSCDKKSAQEPVKRGRGRPRKPECSGGPRIQGTGDGTGADVGTGSTVGTLVQQQQASPMPMAAGPPRKYVKVDDSFDPPKALRQPVIKRAGTSYKCSVSQCPLSKHECSVGLWLFALPCETTDSKMRTAWETSIEIDPTINHPLSPRVCYRHFAKSDFVMRKQRLMGLEEDAVPSIQIPAEAKKKQRHHRITHVPNTSSQPAQSASPDSTAAKAGENPAASADSAANAASRPTASSSRSHVSQPDASPQPESMGTVSRTRERSRNQSTSPKPESDPTVATRSVLNPAAASASDVGSVPASTKPQPESSIAIVPEMGNSTVEAGQAPPSAEVMPPETVLVSDVASVPASTKGSPSTKPESSTAIASERGNSTVVACETLPLRTEAVPPDTTLTSNVASVRASTKGSLSTKPQPESSVPTASEMGDSPVVAVQTPSSAEVTTLEAASISKVTSVLPSTRGSPSTKPQPGSSSDAALETRNSTVEEAVQALPSTEVMPPDAASDSDVGSVPALTKPQPESSIATASETEDSTVVEDQAPPSPEVMPQTSSSALESALTVDTDSDSSTEDNLTSSAQDDPVLDVSFEAAAEPMSSPGNVSSPVPVSESTVATASSAPAAGDATYSAADVIVVPVEETVSGLTVEYTCDFAPDLAATGNSLTTAESAEPPAADEITTATGTSAEHETVPTSGASAALALSRENSLELVEDPKSAVCAGSAGGDSLAPEGQPPSEAAASASPEQNDSSVLLLPKLKPRRESASSASDVTESPEDCSGPQPQLSPSARKRAKARRHRSSKQAANEQTVNSGVSPLPPVGAVSSREQQPMPTVGARLLPAAVNSSKVVIKSEPGTVKSEPDANASCSTAADTVGACTFENMERNPSPATTLSYSSDTDEEGSDKPEVFSGRLFDPSQGRYVVEKEIIGERDDFGMSAVYYRVSWAPK